MRRKFLSVVLCVCMMLTMAPFAFAAEGISSGGGGGGAVAQVGETRYNTLQDAVDHANNNDTIVVLRNTDITATGLTIASGQVVTLDLNGNEVKAANSNTGNIKILGKLTLKDSTDTKANGEGTGKITTSSSYVYNSTDKVLVSAFNGEFVMESGLIDAATNITNNANDGQFAVGVENWNSDASVTINGGKIKAGWYAIAGNGNAKNYNGDITVNGGILESTADYAIYHPQAGTTTINGGVIYGQSGGIAINRGTLVVNDGMITSRGIGSTGSWGDGTGNLNNAAIHANAQYGDVSVSIKNGKVIAECNAVTIDQGTEHNATVAISGGTFSSDVSQYCEKNYYTEKNDDNTYSVKSTKDVAVARIGDTYYRTLTDAYAALPRGTAAAPAEATTITLLKDSAGGGIGSDTDKYMNYVIDFNGHTYTVGAPAVGSTGTVSQGLRVMKTSTAKFMNGTLKAANYENLIQVVHTYGDVTFQDFTVDASEDTYAWAAVEPDNGTLNILGDSSILARTGNYGLYVAFWPRGGYTDGTTVTIDTTGKITGKLAYEWDDVADISKQQTESKAILNIENGNFDITGIETLFTSSIPVEKKIAKINISNGYFSVDPSNYCVSGKTGISTGRADYPYTVGDKADNTTPAPVESATVPAQVDETASADTKTAASSMTEGADLAQNNVIEAAVKNTANNNDIGAQSNIESSSTKVIDGLKKLSDNSSITEADVKIVYQTYIDVKVSSAEKSDNSYTELAVELTPMYRVIATKNEVSEYVVDTDLVAGSTDTANAIQVSKPQPLTLPESNYNITLALPTGFAADGAKLSIKHTKENGSVEYYTGIVSVDSGKTYVTFTTNGFSPFVISAPVASIGDDVYPSLQAAVDAVQNGQTIKLEKNCDETATVSREVNFTLNPNDKTFSGTISAGSRYSLTKTDGQDNTINYTVTYVGGGSSSGTTTSYNVNVNAATNGAVAADKKTASKGTTVTVTASPSKGYVVDAVKVVDKDGKDVAVTGKDGKYVFTMPASAVTVTGSFKAETPAPVALPFTDVKSGNWFYDAVKYAYAQGLMTGTSATTFAPNGTMNRAMIVTVLYRLEKSPAVTGASKFTDVPAGQWYSDAVAWAAANKIVNGYDETTFGPMNAVTREQMAAILFRYEQVKGLENVTLEENLNRFPDQNKISAYAIPALQWAVGQKIINGNADGTLDPTGTATRAQVAQIFTNLLNK